MCKETMKSSRIVTVQPDQLINKDLPRMYKCPMCDGTFSTTSNCKRHMRTLHDVEPIFDNRTPTLKCPLCDDYSKTYSLFDEHLTEKHQVVLLRQKLDFNNFNLFQEWKINEESDTQSSYILSHSHAKHGQKTMKFKCHRSGHFVPRERKSDKSRKLKSKGSNKINCTCPSRLVVTRKANGKVTVEYVMPHVGHEREPDRLRLTPAERDAIAEKLLQGVPKTDILKDISGKYSPTKRISHITRRDLNNIERSLKTKSEVRVKNDDVSRTVEVSSEVSTSAVKVENVEEQEETVLPNEYLLVFVNPDDDLQIKEEGDSNLEHCIVIDSVTSDLEIDSFVVQEKLELKDQLNAILYTVDNSCNSSEEIDFVKRNVDPILPGLQALKSHKVPPKTINVTLFAQEDSRPTQVNKNENTK